MKLSLATTPKKATFAPLLYAGRMGYGIQRAAELGYDGVELNIQDPVKINREKLKKKVKSHGLEIVSFGTGQAYIEEGLCLATSDPGVRNKCENRLKAHILFAKEVGAQVVIGGIRGKLSKDPDMRRIEYNSATEATREIVQFANKKKVTITLEPINRYETNFINTVEEAMEFISDVGENSLKILTDTFHMNIEEVSFRKSIKLAGKNLSHVHLVDSNRLAPGSGHLNIKSIIETLKEIGYEGYLSAEVLPKPDDDTAAKNNITYLKKLLK
jgi:sugar phosphate isomerase/epimerase